MGTNIQLPECQRKRGSNLSEKCIPFPIVPSRFDPVISFTKPSTQCQYKCFVGHLIEDCVLIEDKESMKSIYTMGFFGKGTFSKGLPQDCFEDNEDEDSASPSLSSMEDELKNDEKEWKRKMHNNLEIKPFLESSGTVEEEEEKFQLTFEEAFFLSYGLGCLLVMDGEQPLDIQQLWEKCCDLALDQRFPITYTAYHHFRSKGWVVRSGLKYGVDYVLYKKGPKYYHSTYAVIVKGISENTLQETLQDGRMVQSWSSVAAMNRVVSQVSKALMFLYVITPDIVLKNKISTPLCLSQFKVEEILVKRWVPEEGRNQT